MRARLFWWMFVAYAVACLPFFALAASAASAPPTTDDAELSKARQQFDANLEQALREASDADRALLTRFKAWAGECWEHPVCGKLLMAGGAMATTVGGLAAIGPLLAYLGFTSAGVAAGSVAAAIQAKFGITAAFSVAQSIGAGGLALKTWLVSSCVSPLVGWWTGDLLGAGQSAGCTEDAAREAKRGAKAQAHDSEL